MRRLEQHPLIQHLEPSGDAADRHVDVLRVEKRDLKGSSIWAGPHLAFVIAPDDAETDLFPCADHSDVGWAIGCLVYEWFMRVGIPTNGAHVTRALFSVEDVELGQELKCWFRVDMTNGQSRACPIVEGLDATSPGDYSSVNDYLMTLPQYRKPERLTLRVSAVLIPEARCPDSARELTLRADAGQELRYRVDAGGKLEVTGRSAEPSEGPTLEGIIEVARRKKKPAK